MLSPFRLAHAKHQILQTGSLRCRPVDAIDAHIGRDTGSVQYEVPYLPVEHISCVEPRSSSGICYIAWLVLVTVNERERREIGSGFDNREIIRISNDLSITVVDDRCRDLVGARRKVYYGRTRSQ